MNNLANLEDSFTCKAYVPKIRPESAKSSPTRTRYVSTKLRISQISRIAGPRLETGRIARQVKIRKNKLMCDVGCSTREGFSESQAASFSPILPSKSSKNHLRFIKLNLPGQTEVVAQSVSALRKSQEFIVPNLKRMIGLSHRDSVKIPKTKNKSKKVV